MPDVAAVTLIGKKHLQRGVACEDASIAITRNGVSVICVADGAGSKQYTHARYGSKAAVEVVSDLLINHFDALYNECREAAVRALIIAAVHTKFADLITEHNLDSIDKLSCTLLFCAVKDRRIMFGHIGDGLIAKVTPSGIVPVTMPQNGTDASSTFFVTAPHASDYLRFIKGTTDDIHAICAMTDGVQDMVYDDTSGFVKPVIARMCETLAKGRQSCEEEIKSVLEKYIVGASNVSDDASFATIYFNNTKMPDLNEYPKSADAFPRSEDSFKVLQKEMIPLVKKAKLIIEEAQYKIQNEPASVALGDKPANYDDKNEEREVEPREQTQDEISKISKRRPFRIDLLLIVFGIIALIFGVIIIINILN